MKRAAKMDPKTKQNVELLVYGVALNDFGLTLAPLCGHLLALVGPNWAYKQQIHTFTCFLKAQGGGKCKMIPGSLQVTNAPVAGPP